jgi:hypothetical protein
LENFNKFNKRITIYPDFLGTLGTEVNYYRITGVLIYLRFNSKSENIQVRKPMNLKRILKNKPGKSLHTHRDIVNSCGLKKLFFLVPYAKTIV